MSSEAKIIERLKSHFPAYIGDDAVTIPGSNYVITKDLLVEDVHFRTSYFSPRNLAQKTLQVNLSDLAAMGAQPKYIMCGASIPRRLSDYADELLSHLIAQAKENGVAIIGGDTTSSPDMLYISITAIGECSSPKYRTGAKAGDTIYQIGNLGWAHTGLMALETNSKCDTCYLDAFLQPKAKINEGIWLGAREEVSAMMDISDGLFIDLSRMCNASNVGAIIDFDNFPKSNRPLAKLASDREVEGDLGAQNRSVFDIHEDLSTKSTHQLSAEVGFCKRSNLTKEVMLTGGEDYGLLFTGSKELKEKFWSAFGYHLNEIGRVVEGSGVAFEENGKQIEMDLTPFTHFGEEI